MATEQEELRLTVTLDDQASAQLGRLQAALNNIGQMTGPAATGLNQLGQALRGAGGHAQSLHGSLGGMAARGGFIGGFFFEIGRQAHQMAEEFLKATLDIKAYADSMVSLQQAASRASTSAAQFQRNMANMRMSGISAADAAKNIQGFADAIADLQREQSKVRENLLGGLRGAEFNDMVQFIRRIQTTDRQTATAEAKKFQDDIRAYWTRLGQRERGEAAARDFAAVLGMPDLDRMRIRLETITPEIQKMYERRQDNAERYQTAVEKTDDAWERAVRSVQATSFRVLPIREGAEGIAEFSESIAHWFEDWEGSIADANEELKKIETAEEGGFWFEVFQALGIMGKKTRGEEIREEGQTPEGTIPLPRPRPPIQTWRIPPPGAEGVPQQFMGGGNVGANGPGSTLDVGALGIPSIGDLLAPQAGGGIQVPAGDYAGTGWRGLPMSRNVIDLRGQTEETEAALIEINSDAMEALADELTRLNEFLAPEMIEMMKALMGDQSNYHNAPQGGTEGESNPLPHPPGVQTPGGGAASEARSPSSRPDIAGKVAEALKYIGRNEISDRAMLNDFMKTGGANLSSDKRAWCARFVNAIQTSAGLPSLESKVGADRAWSSRAYEQWGNKVDISKGDTIQAGDVMVKAREGGGHVGVATGNTRIASDGTIEYEMLSGNIGGKGTIPGTDQAARGGGVGLTWETIGGGGKGESTAGAGYGGVISVRRGVAPGDELTGGNVPLPRARPEEAPGAPVAASDNITVAKYDAARTDRANSAAQDWLGEAASRKEKEDRLSLFDASRSRMPSGGPGAEALDTRGLGIPSPGQALADPTNRLMSAGPDVAGAGSQTGWRGLPLSSNVQDQTAWNYDPQTGLPLALWRNPEQRQLGPLFSSQTGEMIGQPGDPMAAVYRGQSGGPPADQGSTLDQPDGAALDRATSSEININQTGGMKVDVNAPAGTSVSVEGSGAFSNTETNRTVPMEQTAPQD